MLGVKIIFSKRSYVAYQSKGDGELNRIQVKKFSRVKLVTFGWVKR